MSHLIVCPHCGQHFDIEEADYAAIVKQVRDAEFSEDVHKQLSMLKAQMDAEKKGIISDYESKLQNMTFQMRQQSSDISHQLEEAKARQMLAVREAVAEKEKALAESQQTALSLQSQIANMDAQHKLAVKNLESHYAQMLMMKDDQIAAYKDFRLKQSTKMVGESLEQYCMTQFNQIRMAAFPNAYFEKDNEVSRTTGSKGDFIFRESIGNVELLSIMFEMKNEMDTTATKHKNEDFFKELDKDRREKHCEYAILVSMLESDSELYNNGIVDVSYRYPKMYVIRPQFFIPMISLLRNAALNAVEARRQLYMVEQANLDVANFENELQEYRESVSKNADLLKRHHDDAVTRIDAAIQNLQKVKEELLASNMQMERLTNKAGSLTIRKLAKNSPGLADVANVRR